MKKSLVKKAIDEVTGEYHAGPTNDFDDQVIRTVLPAFPSDKLYELCAVGRKDRAADLVFEQFNDLMNEADFAGCDAILDSIDEQRIDDSAAIALLAVTLPAKGRLQRRDALVARVRAKLTAKHAPAVLTRMLRGLE